MEVASIDRARGKSRRAARGPAGGGSARKQAILAVCCVAQFMVILDLSIVNVALPSIQVGLRISSADLQWIVDAYAIVFAGFLMMCGRAVDIIGQRRTFVAALAVFSLASLGGGLAPTGTVLITARAIQGFGGAMMAACSLAVITATFAAGPERHRAVALWASMNGLGGAVGTLLSGVITQEVSWRWILLINVPIGIATVVAALAFVNERRSDTRRRFDLPGAVVLTAGQLIVAFGAVNAGTDGWGSSQALVPIAVGIVLLALFPVIEGRMPDPLIPARALTRHLKLVNLIVLLFSAALFPMWYVGSLYLQQVLSLTPIATGLCFLPMALAIMICASRAGKLVGRYGVRPVLTGGLVFMACGLALSARIGASGSAIQYIVLPGVLITMGIGFSIVPSTIAATQAAAREQAGFASGLVNTSRQIGGSLGLAVLVSIATLYTSHQIGRNQSAEAALTGGFRIAYLIGAGLCAAAALLTATMLRTQAGDHATRGRTSTVALAVAAILAVFAAVGFGIPRSVGAPIGTYKLHGAYSFVSAPNLHPPKLSGDPASAARKLPGDILLTSFYDVTKAPMIGQSGPLVIGKDLQPVWFEPVPKNVVADNLNAQTYEGKPVLTWWQGDVTGTGQIDSGEDVVVNQHYQPIATLKGKNGWVLTMHEMIIRGHYAWVTANKNVSADLAKYGGVNGSALIDSAVQEYDLRTGKLVYSWKASDHISPSDSYQVPPENAFPWDAYHVNSIDPQPNGTFLVSMRNTWGIYLVNERTGKIEWTLGGKNSDFNVGKSGEFEWQHDAQLINSTTVSLFDDHCCDITGAGVYLSATGPSRGLVLKLNGSAHTATIRSQYSHGLTFESEYMGNLQQLPNGNAIVGWGEVPYVSEFSRSGQLLFDLWFPSPDMSYRTYVKPWVGLPLTPPAGAVRQTSSGTTVYASWNGATRVTSWRVLAAGPSGAMRAVATSPRKGFETAISVRSDAKRFQVQALDAAGKAIGTSKSFGSDA